MNLKSIFSLCNATPERAVNARRQRKRIESDLYIFFARNGEEEKGQKEILWQSKVCKYFLDLLLARVLA